MQAIVCDQLIDGTGRDPVRDGVVLIEGDRISAVGARSDIQVPRDAEVLDWTGSTAMPGLIDAHEHLGIDLGDEEGQLEQPVEYTVARCVRTARVIITAGITTIRDCGERGAVGPVMRRAIDDGVVPGPRMMAAGRNSKFSVSGPVGCYIQLLWRLTAAKRALIHDHIDHCLTHPDADELAEMNALAKLL